MTTVLLLDFSNIAFATYYAMQHYDNDEFETEEGKVKYWKFMMLNSIKKNKLKHNPDEFIVCVDSKSWRTKAFKYYKAKRKQMRRESNFDYKFFVDNMNEFVNELDENFPYSVMKINGAEADDIIAILAQHLRNKYKKVIIASNDKDFKQIVSGNIHLWNIRDEKFSTVEDNDEYLIRQILTGDYSDGIPNVKSDSDTFINDDKRQKPCGPKTVDKILEQGVKEWVKENGLQKNFIRNRKLIELSPNTIPKGLWELCVKKYEGREKKRGDYTKILKYLSKNRMKALVPAVNQFL